MRYQGWNVFAACPQRRQQHWEHIQTVVEVATKFASRHHLHQITVGCSHQPHVHLVSPSAAQALKFLFLQHPQQLRLERRWNIAHFVEEECAFIGQLKTANLLRYGSSEGAFLVAKQLTFQQIQWNSCAVHSDEWAAAPRANVVNCTRDQLLAGTGFPLDQYGGAGWRDSFDLLEYRIQCRTVANDLIKAPFIRILIAGPQYPDSCHRTPSCCVRACCWLSSPELLEHSRAGLRRQKVLPGTPLRLPSRPASAFFRLRGP